MYSKDFVKSIGGLKAGKQKIVGENIVEELNFSNKVNGN